MKTTSFFFLLFISYTVNAQVVLIDKITKEPIPFVQVFDSEGKFYGMSNSSGVLDIQSLQNSETKKLILYHMSYTEFTGSIKDFLQAKNILLEPKVFSLSEVIVTPSKSRKYFKISGYYRGYQFRDNRLEYFSDGKIELLYDSPLRKTPLVNRVEERFFTSSKLQNRNFIINMIGPIVPELSILPNNLEDSYVLSKSPSNNLFHILDRKGASKKGIIKVDDTYSRIELQPISSENPKIIRLLGNESIINHKEVFYAFVGDIFKYEKLDNLLYHKWTQNLRYKPKDFTTYETFEAVKELFIYSVEYTDEKPPKKFDKFTGFKKESNFSTNFWGEAEKHPFYQPLPSGVAESLKNNLILLPKKKEK